MEKVWKAALNATGWRESLRYEISRALADGWTLEHLAAVAGFDYAAIERLRPEPRHDFKGRQPTDPHAPGQERLTVVDIRSRPGSLI